MKTVWAHFKLLRPLNLSIGAFAVWVSGAILQRLGEITTLVLTGLVVVVYNAAANAINDYFDYETDRINRPDRPLSAGLVRRKTALTMSVVLFGAGSLIVFSLPVTAQLIAIGIAMPLMILYSWRLKGLPLVGNFVVAFILGLTFIFAGTAFGNLSPMFIPALLAFGLTLVRELVKDIADLRGDEELGLKTFPVVAGIEPGVNLAVLFSLIIGLGSFIPYWVGYYGKWYLILLVIGVEIPLAYVIYSLMKAPNDATAKKATRILKFSTIAGVLAVYLGG